MIKINTPVSFNIHDMYRGEGIVTQVYAVKKKCLIRITKYSGGQKLGSYLTVYFSEVKEIVKPGGAKLNINIQQKARLQILIDKWIRETAPEFADKLDKRYIQTSNDVVTVDCITCEMMRAAVTSLESMAKCIGESDYKKGN